MADAAAAPLPWPYTDITLAAITHSLYRPPTLQPARAQPAGRGVTLRDQALFGTRMTKAGRGPKVEGSVKKASVPKAEGSAKKASVRKFQPRPCQVRADVGGPICHQHGGKWLRKTGTGAARRDVYSCGDPGCASEVSKCPRCGKLHAARTPDDFIRNIRACERAGPIQPPFYCPCDSCEGQVLRCVPCTWRAPPRTVSARARIRARRFHHSLLTSPPDLPATRGLGATATSSAGQGARLEVSAVQKGLP